MRGNSALLPWFCATRGGARAMRDRLRAQACYLAKDGAVFAAKRQNVWDAISPLAILRELKATLVRTRTHHRLCKFAISASRQNGCKSASAGTSLTQRNREFRDSAARRAPSPRGR